jgi:hypothetical protein
VQTAPLSTHCWFVVTSNTVASREPRAIGGESRATPLPQVMDRPGARPPAARGPPQFCLHFRVWSGGARPQFRLFMATSMIIVCIITCGITQLPPPHTDLKFPTQMLPAQPSDCTCNLGQRLYPQSNSQHESDKKLIIPVSFASDQVQMMPRERVGSGECSPDLATKNVTRPVPYRTISSISG